MAFSTAFENYALQIRIATWLAQRQRVVAVPNSVVMGMVSVHIVMHESDPRSAGTCARWVAWNGRPHGGCFSCQQFDGSLGWSPGERWRSSRSDDLLCVERVPDRCPVPRSAFHACEYLGVRRAARRARSPCVLCRAQPCPDPGCSVRPYRLESDDLPGHIRAICPTLRVVVGHRRVLDDSGGDALLR